MRPLELEAKLSPRRFATALRLLWILALAGPGLCQSNPPCQGPSDQNGSVYIDPTLPAPNVTVSATSYETQPNLREVVKLGKRLVPLGVIPEAPGGPLGTCTYTLSLPQGTPGLLYVTNDWWLDPGLTSGYSAQWSITATLSSGPQSYANTASIAGSSLPQNPLWTSSACDQYGCLWSLDQPSGVIDTTSLTENSSAEITLTVTDYEPGQAATNTVSVLVVPAMPSILNPVLSLMAGNGITTDASALATLGTPVKSIAADGVARVVLRIPALSVGEQLTLTLLDEQGNPNPPAAGYGRFTTVDGQARPSPLQLTAVRTSQGPMAFAVYIAPANFNYQNNYPTNQSRTVSFAVQALDVPVFSTTTGFTVIRPPVLLVHGLWADPSTWNSFTPLISDPRFQTYSASYSFDISRSVQSSTPSYSGYGGATTSSLGFDYNAGIVLPELPVFLTQFESQYNAAAAQFDVVGHSMGGLVARSMETQAGYANSDSFGVGYIHKIITIGTPHLGSPLAIDMLNGQNGCLAGLLASFGSNYSFLSVTLGGVPGSVPGAMGELQGNGQGGVLSTALQTLQQGDANPVPVAMIVGEAADQNLAGHGCSIPCNAALARWWCSNDQLAPLLTAAGWPTVFSPDPSNDAIVNLTSEQAGGTNAGYTSKVVSGVIHTPALETLDFTGPAELDAASNIASAVINLLNSPATASYGFYPIP